MTLTMLIIPVSPVETLVLASLLIGWSCLQLGYFSMRQPAKVGHVRIPSWARLLASFLVLIGSWLWGIIGIGTQADYLLLGFALGSSLVFLGDALLLSRRISLIYPASPFITYSIAYLIYSISLVSVSVSLNIMVSMVILITFLLVGIIGWLVIVFPSQSVLRSQVASLGYTLLITTMLALTVNLSFQAPIFSFVALGVLLWLFSHSLRVLHTHGSWTVRSASDVIWILHSFGQLCLAFGLVVYTVLVTPTVIA